MITHEVQSPASLPDASLFEQITQWIRKSKRLSELLEAAVSEVGKVLLCDRVKIYQFHPDETGTVVAEWIREQCLPSLLGLTFPADDIPSDARELFVKTGARSIVNLVDRQIGQSGIDPAAPDEIRYRSLSACHAEYLTAMGVQSSLVVPIVQESTLWGLFVIHHAKARTLSEDQVHAVQMVVDLLTVAIAQFCLIDQARDKANREGVINQVSTLLHSLSTIELQAALEKTVAALGGSGGRLWVHAKLLAVEPSVRDLPSTCVRLFQCGCQPTIPDTAPFALLEEYSAWKDQFQSEQDSSWAIADLYRESTLRNLQPAFRSSKIRGLLILPLWYRRQLLGYLTVFRDEIDTEILWAGQFDSDQRQLFPRQSFEIWCESRRGQAVPWTEGDLELASAIAKQFTTAIQQYEAHQQVQALNASLETQVQDRTAQLQTATEQQQALFKVVTEMRKSLEIETIFATVTQEVRRSLTVDRVCIYQFNLDNQHSAGKMIAENVADEFPVALGAEVEVLCFGERYASQYQKGQASSISDVDALELLSGYREVLKRFAIRANIIAPIFQGEQLWGLLCVHQCDRPREWQLQEIQFVEQVAIQLSIAMEQAQLLSQTQHQAQQITEAMQHLKQAQIQLVQTEKMSSLGRLVAGVAHEINNPVSFIHGNLNHLTHYVSDILSLIDTYQQVYPEPQAEILQCSEAIDLDFLRDDLPKTVASMKIGTERIREIVLSLRNFSRLDHADVKPVDIHEGLESTLLILQHRLRANSDCCGIEVVKNYSQLPEVECYAGLLNQVFMNILSNAIDALEKVESPMIRILTKVVENDRVLILIGDNGCGISAEAQAKIFDPFFTTKQIGKGTGLGLSISYEIVTQKHHGKLHCSSVPGEGTEFWIEVPIRQVGE